MFSTLYGTYFYFKWTLIKISSAICFNLDQSKISSSGTGLNIARKATEEAWQKQKYLLDWLEQM